MTRGLAGDRSGQPGRQPCSHRPERPCRPTIMREDSTSPAPAAPPAVLPASPTVPRFWRNPWFWVVLAALALAGWQWLETRGRLSVTQQELARRLAESETAVQEARTVASRALEQTAELQRKYGALEARLGEFQGQAEALRALYQEAALSRDDALIAEVEQNLNIAVQQLQLSGNLQAAILALQAADARLARLERPQFLPLRRTLARDLERLRATPFVDVPGMNLRLENVLIGIDKLPLAVETAASPAAASAETPVPAARWQAFWLEGWQELKSLVRIQRFDRQEAVLLRPDQALMLRENLKLRLLNARLALLSRDPWTFRNELKTAQDWIERYFRRDEKAVQAALAALKQLAATDIAIEYPNLNDSLSALQTLKSGRSRK